ncbi:STAS domain-containing protein [Indiicoccus explosivorum]|uniref:STAS domain-containing protein n=1 Tax=Indiicoccus explosivorum TaxID=1917864 RepID=UPI0013904EC0|nr:STAS domain-containing protein [Indiicoccus explosivorum]
MGKISRELHDYLIGRKKEITEAWLSTRKNGAGTVYAADAGSQTEAQLKAENGAFIDAISRVFIEDKEIYRKYVEQWTSEIAEKRVKTAVPLEDVVGQIRVFRQIYWGFVREFFEEPSSEATAVDALRWSGWMNSAFDYVIESFVRHYQEAHEKILAAQQEVINELSSPVIPIKRGIGILPLVGDIDTYRAKVILETTLNQSTAKGLHTLYIDLSAVPIIDTMVAHQLFQLMEALSVVGVKSILSGIRPEIAQTAISLGLDFGGIEVHANLMRALEALKLQKK